MVSQIRTAQLAPHLKRIALALSLRELQQLRKMNEENARELGAAKLMLKGLGVRI